MCSYVVMPFVFGMALFLYSSLFYDVSFYLLGLVWLIKAFGFLFCFIFFISIFKKT